jgi:hypothetical protein
MGFRELAAMRGASDAELIEMRNAFRSGSPADRQRAIQWSAERETRMAAMASESRTAPASVPQETVSPEDYDSWAERMLGMELSRLQADQEAGR